MRYARRRTLVAFAALVAALAATAAFAGSAGADTSDFNYTVSPLSIQGPALSPAVAKELPGLGNDCTALFGTSFTLNCYDPHQIRDIYNVPSNLTGAGQTIVIVDAYGDPTIQQDLANFDADFNLPAPPSFTVYQGSATQTAGTHAAADWALETALDVEYAHAIAPGAAIVLAEAPSSSGNAINSTEKQIVSQYPGAILSQSFGINENAINGGGNNIQAAQADANYQSFAQLGITSVASAGDYGATTGTASNTPSFPSSDPNVTAVGGTQGNPYPGGLGICRGQQLITDDCTYGGEAAWNEPDFGAATGGAPSQIFSAPSYQAGLTGYSVRTTPDVSYNAAINGGVLVILGQYVELVGGTSCGSPQWAGIFALTNQARANAHKAPLGAANAALYSIYTNHREYSKDFHDITVGNNTLAGAPVQGYSAGKGYDLATGIGTPNVANLIGDLAK